MPDTAPRRFQLARATDVTGVSGVGLVADGVLWPDGAVSVRWRGEMPSTVAWECLDHVVQVHGHAGHTRILWLDDDATGAETVNGVYRERAALVAYLATQHPAVLAYTDPDAPDWAVVYVHTPAGQMSWHIAPEDVDLFAHVAKVTPDDQLAEWDGHDTPTKYERLAHMTRFAALANDQRGR
ncbi:hypothetical protein [Actinomadura rubrisoli]|uniref:WDGH domain-containing protein n=1 Tax=Actinomadura rubrisoli TaxID=2530368 RepID=UPI001A9FA008|nr:hypothetical protein [Actinomadura rubrisoli]